MIKNLTRNENGITDKELKFSFLKQGSSNSEIVTIKLVKKNYIEILLSIIFPFHFFNFRNMNNNTLYCFLKETERWIEMTNV